MTGVVFEEVAFGRLLRSNFSFDAGLSVITGSEHEGLSEIVALCTGLEVPTRGRVRVFGAEPQRSPSTRQSIAHLLAKAELIPAPTLLASVNAALKLRGTDADAERTLANAGLSEFARRRVSLLNHAERQAVALSIALAHPQPKLLVLYEPLCVSPEFRRDYLFERVNSLVKNGALGLVATSSTRDAHAFAGRHVELVRGEIVGPSPTSLMLGERVLRVSTDKPRELLEQLVKLPEVSGVLLRDPAPYGAELEVRGPDLETLARLVSRSAATLEASIHRLEAILPSVEELYAARLGAQRAVYERAYAGARMPAPTPPRAPIYDVTPAPQVTPPPPPGEGR